MEHTSVFLSYRREDSAGHTGRLHDRLVDQLGRDRVFLDIDNIQPGDDFIEAIDATLDRCSHVLVIVGRRWLEVRDNDHRRRLDNPADNHRLEIERALQRKVRVVPVLVGGAEMPPADQLPESLRAFARRNAFEISDKRFDSDASNLARVVKETCAKDQANARQDSTTPQDKPSKLPVRGRVLAALAGVAMVLAAIVYSQRVPTPFADAPATPHEKTVDNVMPAPEVVAPPTSLGIDPGDEDLNRIFNNDRVPFHRGKSDGYSINMLFQAHTESQADLLLRQINATLDGTRYYSRYQLAGQPNRYAFIIWGFADELAASAAREALKRASIDVGNARIELRFN